LLKGFPVSLLGVYIVFVLLLGHTSTYMVFCRAVLFFSCCCCGVGFFGVILLFGGYWTQCGVNFFIPLDSYFQTLSQWLARVCLEIFCGIILHLPVPFFLVDKALWPVGVFFVF